MSSVIIKRAYKPKFETQEPKQGKAATLKKAYYNKSLDARDNPRPRSIPSSVVNTTIERRRLESYQKKSKVSVVQTDPTDLIFIPPPIQPTDRFLTPRPWISSDSPDPLLTNVIEGVNNLQPFQRAGPESQYGRDSQYNRDSQYGRDSQYNRDSQYGSASRSGRPHSSSEVLYSDYPGMYPGYTGPLAHGRENVYTESYDPRQLTRASNSYPQQLTRHGSISTASYDSDIDSLAEPQPFMSFGVASEHQMAPPTSHLINSKRLSAPSPLISGSTNQTPFNYLKEPLPLRQSHYNSDNSSDSGSADHHWRPNSNSCLASPEQEMDYPAPIGDPNDLPLPVTSPPPPAAYRDKPQYPSVSEEVDKVVDGGKIYTVRSFTLPPLSTPSSSSNVENSSPAKYSNPSSWQPSPMSKPGLAPSGQPYANADTAPYMRNSYDGSTNSIKSTSSTNNFNRSPPSLYAPVTYTPSTNPSFIVGTPPTDTRTENTFTYPATTAANALPAYLPPPDASILNEQYPETSSGSFDQLPMKSEVFDSCDSIPAPIIEDTAAAQPQVQLPSSPELLPPYPGLNAEPQTSSPPNSNTGHSPTTGMKKFFTSNNVQSIGSQDFPEAPSTGLYGEIYSPRKPAFADQDKQPPSQPMLNTQYEYGRPQLPSGSTSSNDSGAQYEFGRSQSNSGSTSSNESGEYTPDYLSIDSPEINMNSVFDNRPEPPSPFTRQPPSPSAMPTASALNNTYNSSKSSGLSPGKPSGTKKKVSFNL